MVIRSLLTIVRAAAVSAGVVLCALPANAQAYSAIDEVDSEQAISQTVIDLAAWVIASGDNRGSPFAIVDKDAAQILVFDAKGKVRGLAPVLLGSAVGDDSAPGVGERELKNIPMKERTTPAGRFLAAFGPAAGDETVLWIDFASSVSIHPIADSRSSKKEKRTERLASPETDDNRITHGCVNVSPEFYAQIIAPTFEKGGVFYVLPESMSVAKAFPGFQLPDRIAQSGGSGE